MREDTRPAARAPSSFVQLTDLPGEERQAQIGPAGIAFVFVGGASANPDVYLQRVGGRNPFNHTADSLAADTAPAFSPDGERIAFRGLRNGCGQRDIRTIAADAKGEPEPATSDPAVD